MLRLEPMHWYSWAFTVSREGRAVAALDISTWRERGRLEVEGQRFTVDRERLMSGDFRLHRGEPPSRGSGSGPAGALLATAAKPSLFRRRFVVTFSGRRLVLERRSGFGRAFVVREGDREVGDITPERFWSRRATANLPDNLPLPIQAFLLWLALLVWKRDADDSSAAG